MTTRTLERKLRPLGKPVQWALLKWLYLRLPPRPILNKKTHAAYSRALSILMRALEESGISTDDRRSIEAYLEAAAPFIEEYEKKEFPLGQTSPEDMLRFLMEQNNLSQYDLASDLGGQPVVSDILHGKRHLTREHIERLSLRFHVSPAAFYPAPA
ncbi:MAG: helix-turn-helix domain-containing protein [Elusimicrobia bacterium]|nr:helix-turn-helix domain-containing protein [Elusimicrobiota bacterium]